MKILKYAGIVAAFLLITCVSNAQTSVKIEDIPPGVTTVGFPTIYTVDLLGKKVQDLASYEGPSEKTKDGCHPFTKTSDNIYSGDVWEWHFKSANGAVQADMRVCIFRDTVVGQQQYRLVEGDIYETYESNRISPAILEELLKNI